MASEQGASSRKWRVHKFGGTSVAEAKCFQRVKSIIESQGDGTLAIVCSAMGGKPKVTDLLLQSVETAARGDSFGALLQAIREKHVDCAESILAPDAAADLIEVIDHDLSEIQDILRAVSLMRFEFEPIRELVSGYGELWSTQMMVALLKSYGMNVAFLDARRVLRIEELLTGPAVMWEESEKLLDEFMSGLAPGTSIVITGYVASTKDGKATTLKVRFGADPNPN